MEKKEQLKKYNLDNSSLFYPIMATKKAQSLFRLTVVLCDQVDGEILRQAVQKTMDRFPIFKTELKMGYAWHYLSENTKDVKVFDKSKGVLAPIDPKETNGYLFRFVYEGNTIILEVFHGLCDGTGASIFFKGVLQQYRKLQGVEIGEENAIDFNEEFLDEENEDAFKKYYTPIKFKDADIKSLTGVKPQLITGTINPDGYTTETYFGSYKEIGALAKERGVSFTAFIAGIVAHSIANADYGKNPIVVMVPVNLRAIFPSKTVRNFASFVRLTFDINDCLDVEECIKEASVQLKEKTKVHELEKMLGTTVRTEKTLILKIAPLWLKMAVAKFFRLFLKSRQTIIISNLGRFNLPEGLGVDKAIFNINVSKNARTNVAIISLGDTVAIALQKPLLKTRLQTALWMP
ncbi:MAG: hypothetical protein J6Q06_03720 [Clostridia bacterium]|nr:hypothetical protein [Clostridia bacterium]